MAKFTVGSGIDQYIRQLTNLEFESEEMVKRAVYEGAKIVANAIKGNINSLSVGSGQGQLTAAQKEGLQRGMGISHMENRSGSINVKIGFAGRNTQVTRTTYPRGQYNTTVARALESGTSTMRKQPFVNAAVMRSRAAAEQAMAKMIDEEIGKRMH